MSGQSTLSDISDMEGGGEADEGREPSGFDPVTTFPYPDIGDRLDAREPDEEFEWVPHSERDEGPNNARKTRTCPMCGADSSKCYACSECGKLFDGSAITGTTDTAVGD